MQTFLSGKDITIAVPLTRNGEPVVPDAQEISWEVRGHDGAVLSGGLSNDQADSIALIPIDEADNELSGGRVLEKRTLIVTWEVAGATLTTQAVYQIHDFLNHTVTPQDVRSFIGIDSGELSDDEIDITGAFFDLAAVTTLASLSAGLAGNETAQRRANKGIIAQAVINLLPGLPQRLSKAESDGTSKVERFPIDFDKLGHRANAALETALNSLTSTATTGRTLIVLTERTDPMTGV